MATTREIRRRIRSVRNVEQITRAVQLVASSKRRRARERVLAARPYSEELIKLLSRRASQAEGQEDLPLMRSRPVRKVGIVVMTPDKGLAGALSSNVNRRAGQLALELRRESGANLPITFIAVGRKARDFLRRTQQPMIAEFTALRDPPSTSDMRAIAQVIKDAYLNEDVEPVYLVYPRFVSTVVQTPTVAQILPVQPPEAVDVEGPPPQYIFAPDADTIIASFLERDFQTLVVKPLHQPSTR